MSNASCPCCGRKYAAVKVTGDKKLIADRERAQLAIQALRRGLTMQWDNPSVVYGIESELERMKRAINDLPLLWSIYRRRDKATGYGMSKPAPRSAQPERELAVA